MESVILNKDGFLVNGVQVEADFQIRYKELPDIVDKIVVILSEELNAGKTKECDEVIEFLNSKNRTKFYTDDMRYNDDEFDIDDFICTYQDEIEIMPGHPIFNKILEQNG